MLTANDKTTRLAVHWLLATDRREHISRPTEYVRTRPKTSDYELHAMHSYWTLRSTHEATESTHNVLVTRMVQEWKEWYGPTDR